MADIAGPNATPSDRSQQALLSEAAVNARDYGLGIICLLSFIACVLLYLSGPFFPKGFARTPLAQCFIGVILIAVVGFIAACVNLLSMFLAACVTPDPRRPQQVLAAIQHMNPSWRHTLTSAYVLHQCLSIGMIVFAIENRDEFVAFFGWLCSTLPMLVIYCIFSEPNATTDGSALTVIRERSTETSTNPSVPPESLQILEQALQAGVPLNSVHQQLDRLIQHARPATTPVNDQQLLAKLETDLASIRGSGLDRHLIEAEVEFVKNEFYKLHPHLRGL